MQRRTRMFLHGLCASTLAHAVVVAISAASDEGGVAGSERVLRAVPAGALATFAALALVFRRAQQRGEVAAFARAGFRPFEAPLGAWLGGALPTLAALAVALRKSRLDMFYPRPPALLRFVWEGEGFLTTGLRVAADGGLTQSSDALADSAWQLPAHATSAATCGVVCALVGCVLLSAAPDRRRAIAWVVTAHAASLVLFQLASAAHASALLAPLPLAALAGFACLREVQRNWLHSAPTI